MPKTQLINLMLLPGMDGTGLLFRRFLDVLPADLLAKVISYPPNIPTTYAEAEKIVWEALPHGEDFVLLGESYSGPIALRLAARRPAGLRAVVLVASFAFAPKTMFGAVVSKLGVRLFPSHRLRAWFGNSYLARKRRRRWWPNSGAPYARFGRKCWQRALGMY